MSIGESVCIAVGSAVLVVGITSGNGMILAAPVGLWTFIMALPASAPVHSRQRSRKGSPAFAQTGAWFRDLWNWRLGCILVVWGSSIALLAPRALRTPAVSDRDIAAAIAQADALVAAGRLEEALDRYRQTAVSAALPKRNAQKWHNMGVVLLRLERYKEAASALRRAVQFDPSDASAQEVLGRLQKDGF